MRSNSVTKVAKPPPPIPPRPNKILVAEALAKTRGTSRAIEDNSNQPPLNGNGYLPVKKSQSSHSLITTIKSGVRVQRSTSNAQEKIRENNSRPVIFQSSNLLLKTAPQVNKSVQPPLLRNDSGCDLKKNTNHVLINLENGDKNHRECNRVNRNNSFKDNEKNHVNALIDEMFASILDIPDGDDANAELPEAFNENVNIPKQHHTDSTESPAENKLPEPVIIDSSPNTTIKISNESLKETVETESASESNETDDNYIKTDEKPSSCLKFVDDKMNHEFLISELQNMHKEYKRQKRPPPLDLSDDKIHRSDWVELNTNGQEVRLSRCEIIIDDCDNNLNKDVDVTTDIISRLNNMSSYGLPPLPKSLSGFSLNPQTPSRVTPPNSGFSPCGHMGYSPHQRLSNGATSESIGRSPTNLDNQLAILRREMYSLRQLDLSLLSQLWSLNESIQEFRQMLQEQDDRGLSPPSPSPSPSSCDDGETDEFFSPSPMKLRPAPPPPPLRRTSNSSSANSSEYGTV